MSDTNLFLYPAWRNGDEASWKKALSVLVSRNVIATTGEGSEEGEIWFSPGKRSSALLKGAPEPAFDDCRVHFGSTYFIPDGDTTYDNVKCPACGASLEEVVVVEAIVNFNNEADEEDRQKCPGCKKAIDVTKLTCSIPTALTTAFLCFVAVQGETPAPDTVKALEEATGCAWKWLTEKVEL